MSSMFDEYALEHIHVKSPESHLFSYSQLSHIERNGIIHNLETNQIVTLDLLSYIERTYELLELHLLNLLNHVFIAPTYNNVILKDLIDLDRFVLDVISLYKVYQKEPPTIPSSIILNDCVFRYHDNRQNVSFLGSFKDGKFYEKQFIPAKD